jgi:hypothetical protein
MPTLRQCKECKHTVPGAFGIRCEYLVAKYSVETIADIDNRKICHDFELKEKRDLSIQIAECCMTCENLDKSNCLSLKCTKQPYVALSYYYRCEKYEPNTIEAPDYTEVHACNTCRYTERTTGICSLYMSLGGSTHTCSDHKKREDANN